MLTADTITDEQIREMLSDLVYEGAAGSDIAEDCHTALDGPNVYWGDGEDGFHEQRRRARARIAEILNAREAKS